MSKNKGWSLKLSTTSLVLIPTAVGINYIGKLFAGILKPLFSWLFFVKDCDIFFILSAECFFPIHILLWFLDINKTTRISHVSTYFEEIARRNKMILASNALSW